MAFPGVGTRLGKWGAIVVLTMALFASSGAARAAETHRSAEVLVLFRGASSPVRMTFATEADATEAMAAYGRDPAVAAAARNSLVRIAGVPLKPDDEFFGSQWYLEKVRGPEAWSIGQGSRTVVVAVLDTGTDLDHPDLRNNLWTNPREVLDGLDNDGNGYPDDVHGWNFVDDTGNPEPHVRDAWNDAGMNHGTMVSGIVGAVGNNRIGIAGTSWYVRIMPVRVLDSTGVGDVDMVARGIDYAVRNGAQVLNLSFVGLERNDVLEAAILRAHDAGVVIVAAAGNDSADGGLNLDANPQYPACSDGGPGRNFVLGVTATDETDRKASFAGYGTHCVDLAAPGISMFSTRFEDASLSGFGRAYGGYWQGTSLATPIVAGAAALLKALDPTLGNDQIVETLLRTADRIDAANPLYVGKLGAGRLNIAAAVESVKRNLPLAGVSTAYMGVGAPAGMPAAVRLFASNGGLVRTFTAFPAPFTGGVNAASGDLDGDGHDEIVAAPRSGGPPRVRVFDTTGLLRSEFLAYASTFSGGVTVAVGDVDGDGTAEIVTGAGKGGGPHVRVFDMEGHQRGSFFAYGTAFRGGVNVAVGDVDGDGKAEIVTGPGPGGGPHVRIFDGFGFLKGEFFVGKKDDTRGLRVAVGDTQAQGIAGIAVAPASGAANTLYLLNSLGVLYGLVEINASVENFPFALGDVDGRGRSYLLVSVPTVGGMSLSVYDTDGKERAYALTYTERAIAPPAPFVVRKP